MNIEYLLFRFQFQFPHSKYLVFCIVFLHSVRMHTSNKPKSNSKTAIFVLCQQFWPIIWIGLVYGFGQFCIRFICLKNIDRWSIVIVAYDFFSHKANIQLEYVNEKFIRQKCFMHLFANLQTIGACTVICYCIGW